MVRIQALVRRWRGFTLIELLVVIAIMATLMGLLLPAVQKVREAAARMSSTNNLKQIGIAMANYEAQVGKIVSNGSNTNQAKDWCWAFHLLPYLEQATMYDNALASSGSQPPNNVPVKALLCPARGRTPIATTGGNSPGFNGPFTDYAINGVSFNQGSNSDPANGALNRLTLSQVTSKNGTGMTIFAGEKYVQLAMYTNTSSSGWEECIYTGGYGGTARTSNTILKDGTTGNNNQWGSPFGGACPFVFCDGSVRPILYGFNGSTAFTYALTWNSGQVFIIN